MCLICGCHTWYHSEKATECVPKLAFFPIPLFPAGLHLPHVMHAWTMCGKLQRCIQPRIYLSIRYKMAFCILQTGNVCFNRSINILTVSSEPDPKSFNSFLYDLKPRLIADDRGGSLNSDQSVHHYCGDPCFHFPRLQIDMATSDLHLLQSTHCNTEQILTNDSEFPCKAIG